MQFEDWESDPEENPIECKLSQTPAAIRKRRSRMTNAEHARRRWIIDRHTQRAKRFGSTGSFTWEEWEAVLKAHNYACARCGATDSLYERLQIDHIIPLQCGGTNTADNLQPLCPSCNNWKRTKAIDYRKEKPNVYAHPSCANEKAQ
ncbi:MAG: HNH endonuclease [Acidobacteriota bacterium]